MATAATKLTESELIRRRERLLGPAYRLFYDEPFHPVRGEGVWLYDAGGQPFLDVYNNVPCVGHCHPHVVDALTRQAALLNTHTRYLHETVLDYAEMLLAKFPSRIGHSMFTCTGSEANDLALRMARTYTGGTGVIVTELAYHGGTIAIAEISPSLGDKVPLGKHVRTVPAPDSYRSEEHLLGENFARGVAAAIDSLKADGIKPAALICDTIFASDGVFSHPPGFLRPAVELIRSAGGLFIADEVQAGFARTGECFWGFQRHGVVPDIVTMGKPMGNGHPIAGAVVRPDIAAPFGEASRYFNTFGGNPVSAAAGKAVLEVIENEGLQENARCTGDYMRDGIRKLAERHEIIGDVRGSGLFTGVELVRDRATKEPADKETAQLVNEMRRRHVLISFSGPNNNCLKVRPPLVFSEDNANYFLQVMDGALSAI
ncbi:MAG: aspartate aminotransferase family protein [Gammaproteobacteria bacterium]